MNTFFSTIMAVGTDIPSESANHWKLYIFFGILAICVILFIYFLIRTDKLIDKKYEIKVIEQTKVKESVKTLHDEEAAAIALAIHLYKSALHDMESFTITLQKVSRIYSPWSSKIYSMRQHPRH